MRLYTILYFLSFTLFVHYEPAAGDPYLVSRACKDQPKCNSSKIRMGLLAGEITYSKGKTTCPSKLNMCRAYRPECEKDCKGCTGFCVSCGSCT
ncbi:hypothetical protein C1646_721034 [Rhizophagus diaphanus]|nr:hypothetical protein C1646_721034 [Rhizophagus diaphanus] [Rhizophagus sp. MUCL 43196]